VSGLYRPRAVAVLYVPNVGTAQARTQQEEIADVTKLQIRVQRVRLVSNSHNDADECEIVTSYDDAGIDPRFLRSCEMYLYLGDGDENGDFVAGPSNLRFVGIATDVERIFDEGQGKSVRIRALDYTTLFLSAKQFPPAGIPDFSQTLKDAWRRVCDHTGYYDLETGTTVSTVQRLRDRIQFVGVDEGITIGRAVGARIRALGKVQVKGKPDAWAVWQTAVGSLGLISFIRGDTCIITTATDYYTADDPPQFVYGKNILKLTERRDVNALARKNVCIESFNPLTMQTLESFWPPLSMVRRTGKGMKKLGASARGGGVEVRAQDYEVFDCPVPTTDPAMLEKFAERVWEERTRQELAGEITTREMFGDTVSGQVFDLIGLQAGDRIRVEIDREALTIIQRQTSMTERISALVDQGYSTDMAGFIATNLDSITKLPPEFQVHSVATELDCSSADGGTYEMRIRYLNRIDVSGASQQGTGESTPAFTGQKPTAKNPAGERRRNARL
jgi:hypothetical protein